MNKSLLRVIAGFLIAPGIPALVMYLVQFFFIGHENAVQGAFVLGVIGYFSAGILGVPTYIILRRKQITSLRVYLPLGACIGTAYYALLFMPAFIQSMKSNPDYALVTLKNTFGLGLIGVIGGLVASLIFWLIAVKNN